MMLALYRILTTLAAPAALPLVGLVAVFSSRWRLGLGRRLALVPKSRNRNRLLIHLASVGEVISAGLLVDRIAQEVGEENLLLSVMTPTGYQEARRRFPGRNISFFPADAGPVPGRWLRRMGIRRVILFETEIWPLFLDACRQGKIPVALVNARISDRSFPRYRLLAPFLRPLWKSLALVATQNVEHRERLLALGVSPERSCVIGNLKFDSAGTGVAPSVAGAFIKEFAEGRPVLVFASTHAGEEEIVLEALDKIFHKHPDAAALIAPRHKERFDSVWEKVLRAFPEAHRRSLWKEGQERGRVLLLDTLGELSSCFPFAYAAFLGGSLVDVGGHNLLEPAAFGLPVLIGPHTQNFRAEVELLKEAKAAIVVKDGSALTRVLIRLLDDPAERDRLGAAGRKAVEEGRGALQRTMDLLESKGFFPCPDYCPDHE